MARAASAHSKPHDFGYNLVVIALFASLAALALGYGVHGLAPRPQPWPALNDESDLVVTTIAGRELTIPRNWLRLDVSNAQGFSSEVDLKLMLPLGEAGALEPVEITLLPRSRARPSAALLDGVYLHQFGTDELSGPPGLIGKPLTGGNGFAGESVWYDPLSPDPFAAKCLEAPIKGQETRCLRTVFLPTGVAAIYAFDAPALNSWRSFDATLAPWLQRIGAL